MSDITRRIGMCLAVLGTLLLAAGCASSPPSRDGESNGSRPDRNAAETAFAMYLNDPENQEAWQWVCQAASGGVGPAQFIVATRYRDGLPPVQRDPARAFLWFSAADRSGLVAAALEREKVGKQLPEDQARAIDDRVATAGEKDCAVPAG